MSKVTFDADRCKGCSLCVSACPKKILALSEHTLNARGFHPAVIVDQGACIACAFCAMMCPDTVITVEK
ncbi:MAG: 4Fe-4S dicluster domain-containing protein [Oscillospiraceae bacterium]|jgi:2-oxoglutarate ferredoxin oxidoreductase subunit delta|nr:4Fe-4S dicluster domain-containing protein [Oscillospiraceae bacterium]